MRILIVSEGFGQELFGVSQVIIKLNEKLRSYGVSCRVLVSKLGDISGVDVDVRKIPAAIGGNPFRWHPDLFQFYVQEIKEFKPDVIHIHGVFTFVQYAAVQAAHVLGVPVLLSLHGMLEEWTWRQKGSVYYFAKRMYWRALLSPVFKLVDTVHVITRLEAETARHELGQISQVLIPNAMDFSKLPALADQPRRNFVFLGRLHPKKGVELLIKAFAQARLGDDWRLIIAGPDQDPAYGRRLLQLVRDLRLNDQIQLIGPVYGDGKYKLMSNAWAVVVPSFSEVIAMVNLESAAVCTPTITTRVTGLDDWDQGGGLLIDPREDQLTQALAKVASWSLAERMQNGENAHRFVRERYGWDAIAPKWLEAYQVLKKGVSK